MNITIDNTAPLTPQIQSELNQYEIDHFIGYKLTPNHEIIIRLALKNNKKRMRLTMIGLIEHNEILRFIEFLRRTKGPIKLEIEFRTTLVRDNMIKKEMIMTLNEITISILSLDSIFQPNELVCKGTRSFCHVI